jgi:ubiquinone/menaquinone biosynthesis C-methylase UbiE
VYKREVSPELLDTDSGTPTEITDSLADLRWINRTFGGTATTVELLRRVSAKAGLSSIRFLDVAGASGDVAEGARAELAKHGVELSTTVLDRSFGHLGEANHHMAVVGDAFRLPFRDGALDVVGSALFIHHLEPEQIVQFINESLRVSRYACIVNDLRRSRLHLLAVQGGRLFYRSRITSHDSAASVRRAYTPEELREILKVTEADHFEFSEHFMFRLGIIAWKRTWQHERPL